MTSRLYIFNNMYLQGIQAGIQSQHSTVELFLKYQPTLEENTKVQMLYEWAAVYKTTIILNGGDSTKLGETLSTLEKCDLPFAYFMESGINDALTSVCVLVPEYIYTAVKEYKESLIEYPNDFSINDQKIFSLLVVSKLM